MVCCDVIHRNTHAVTEMPKETVSIRLDTDKRAELDQLASAFDRDRSYLIGEAIDAYLDVQRWHLEQIRQGVRQADADEFAEDAEVQAVFAGR